MCVIQNVLLRARAIIGKLQGTCMFRLYANGGEREKVKSVPSDVN